MAKQSKTSGLMKSLGKAGATSVASHAKDKTAFDEQASLPNGIDNGIAKLTDCRFGQYKTGDMKGKYFFLAAGIVVSPDRVGKFPVKGLRTQIMEPMCDTPTRKRSDVDDHVEWVMNEMRKLGLKTAGSKTTDLEVLAAALKKSAPYFTFRTWQGEATKEYPDPRVNEVWNGRCDYDPAKEDDGDDVVDETAEDEEEPEDDAVDDDDLDDDDDEETDDLEALAAQANDDDDEESGAAEDKLIELAVEAGMTEDEANDVPSWSDLATMIREASKDEEEEEDADEEDADEEEEDEEEEEEEEEEEVESPPEKGDVYQYKPPKKKKLVGCEVTAVFAGKETANLKNLGTGKTYKSIPWDKLVVEE